MSKIHRVELNTHSARAVYTNKFRPIFTSEERAVCWPQIGCVYPIGLIATSVSVEHENNRTAEKRHLLLVQQSNDPNNQQDKGVFEYNFIVPDGYIADSTEDPLERIKRFAEKSFELTFQFNETNLIVPDLVRAAELRMHELEDVLPSQSSLMRFTSASLSLLISAIQPLDQLRDTPRHLRLVA